MHSAEMGDAAALDEMLRHFERKRFDVNDRDALGYSALHYAASHGRLDVRQTQKSCLLHLFVSKERVRERTRMLVRVGRVWFEDDEPSQPALSVFVCACLCVCYPCLFVSVHGLLVSARDIERRERAARSETSLK